MRGAWKTGIMVVAAGGLICTPAALGNWVEFADETADRLVADSDVGINDSTERHYSWGDVNKNGWLDLAVARKSPQTSTGHFRNVLFMNENGILVDRTAEYASAAVVDGHNDQGFLTETNDRRVLMVDVNDNGWLDMVTATTLSFGNPKHIAYPRVYVNQGENGAGEWQGFVFEDDRIPQFEGNAANGMPHAPRFCGLAAGDVTGNGLPDLYFADYDSGSDGGSFDFNDRLLVNQGDGYFEDESHRIPSAWLNSTFGTAAHIADMNGNGVNDIVRSHSFGCYCVTVIYNDPDNEGHFVQNQSFGSPYFAHVADLNNNGRMDMVVAADGSDTVRWNLGNQSNGQVNWLTHVLPNSGGVDGNKITFADLNNDGWTDFVLAGNDPDFGGCRIGYMWRNNGDETFTNDFGNLPSSVFNGSYHIAAFDISGNGWTDLVVGKCSGTQVLINQPSAGIEFDFPQTLPEVVLPNTETDVVVEIVPFPSGESIAHATLHASVDGGEFQASTMSHVGDDEYLGTLPAIECAASIEYYFEATLESGLTITEPTNAPATTFTATALAETQIVFEDDISGDVSGWAIESDPSLASGEWEQATPNPVIIPPATLAQPDGPSVGSMAFITENCPAGTQGSNAALECSVSLGPTRLISPTLQIGGIDAVISYDRWFFCNHQGIAGREDFLITEISNDNGLSWTFVHQTGGTGQAWETVEFVVGNYVEPTDQVRVRFSVEDADNSSITNAAIDNFNVEEFVCEPGTCLGDLTGSGEVDVFDLIELINSWGPCADPADCPADLNEDNIVDVFDLIMLINNWGPCS